MPKMYHMLSLAILLLSPVALSQAGFAEQPTGYPTGGAMVGQREAQHEERRQEIEHLRAEEGELRAEQQRIEERLHAVHERLKAIHDRIESIRR